MLAYKTCAACLEKCLWCWRSHSRANACLLFWSQVRLQVGLYAVYLLDWLTVFDKEQFLILRLEDHASNVKFTMHRVFQFLSLGTDVTPGTGSLSPEQTPRAEPGLWRG